MGYLHISNLYADTRILHHKECFCLEKIHGTSAHVRWCPDNGIGYHPGGETMGTFKPLFNEEELVTKFSALHASLPDPRPSLIVIHGEAYGGKQQKNQWRYGPKLKFCAFDVKFKYPDREFWLPVLSADSIVGQLGLEFVHFKQIPCTLEAIDAERDAQSEQAVRNGVTTHGGEFIRREGVVLRTLNEELDERGLRIITKHKRAEERETKTERKVDTSKVQALQDARAIAEEWVVPMRLMHVLGKLEGEVVDMTRTSEVIRAMIEDVNREGAGEFHPSNTVNAEISKATGKLLKQHLENKLRVYASDKEQE
jgi:hypothetical protein